MSFFALQLIFWPFSLCSVLVGLLLLQQARNQLGAPGGANSFLRGAQKCFAKAVV